MKAKNKKKQNKQRNRNIDYEEIIESKEEQISDTEVEKVTTIDSSLDKEALISEFNDNVENSAATIKENEIMLEILSRLPAMSQIMFKIFSHLPIKTLFKFKSISKTYSKLISDPIFAFWHFQNLKVSSPFTGFFCQTFGEIHFAWTEYYHTGPALTPVNGNTCELPDRSLSFLKDGNKKEFIKLVDSSNGLLLCSSTNCSNGIKVYYICNPLTKERVQLPHPCKRSNRVHYALVADPSHMGYICYKVVCVFQSKGREAGSSELLIFSSETGKWEEFEERLPPVSHETLMGSKVIFNGALFWDCLEGYILVCYLKETGRCYKLIEAPQAPIGRSMWEYKGKLLCYCHGYTDEFPIWSLCFCDGKPPLMEWKLEGCEEFKSLTEDICRGYNETITHEVTTKVAPFIQFKVIAYSPGLKTLFLRIPDAIFSFALVERKLKWVSGYVVRKKFHSSGCTLPYVHSFAPMQIGGVAKEKQEAEIKKKKKKKKM